MSSGLTHAENEIVDRLRRADPSLSVAAATLAVVMVTREHARPTAEVAHQIRQYQNLEDTLVAERAISELRNRRWIVETNSADTYLLHQVEDLREKLAYLLNDPSVADELLAMRSTLEPFVKILGPMKDKLVYESYLHALREAQREICLPMLATSPSLSSVPIIQERARKGVPVRIVLGAPELVSKIRGGPAAQIARAAIQGWVENARGVPNMEVRVSRNMDFVRICSCLTIDRRLLRFDVFDPMRQRSLEGVMIEVLSPDGHELNLIGVFQHCFDAIWEKSESTTFFGKLWSRLGSSWQWWCFIVFAVLSFLAVKRAVWSGIFASAAATFLVNALVSAWPRLHSYFRRFSRDD